jgi:CDP-diglyceride synthetase
MPEKSEDLVQRLIDAEEINPALRRSYQAELDAMLTEPLTPRKAAPGVFLLVLLALGCVVLVRNLLVIDAKPTVQAGWLALLFGFAAACYPIARDLGQRKHSKKSLIKVTTYITTAAVLLTAMAMIRGMSAASEPASTFHVLFALVFLVICQFWSLDSRMTAAELAAREQMLRLEYRLAELGDSLKRE